MKLRYWIILVVGILLVGAFVIANPLEIGRQDFGTIVFSTPSKLPNQTIGGCVIKSPITPYVDIVYLDEKNEILNYTLKINFGGTCVQGMDGHYNPDKLLWRQISYSGTTYQEAIKQDIIQRFAVMYNNRTIKVSSNEPVIKGRYN